MVTETKSFSVRKLSGHVGAEIVDIAIEEIDDVAIREVRSALFEHGVLVFRRQFLSPEQHVAFAKLFGELMVYEGFEKEYRNGLPPGMFKFSNDGKEKVITETWHFDGTYYDVPPAINILAPHFLPAYGGDTMWSSQYQAYDSLSSGMKELLAGLRTNCVSHRVTQRYALGKLFSAEQPAVRRHPVTGRLSLYVGYPETCSNFVGLTEEESQPLIRYLHSHANQPDNCYRHHWELGDVVVWDNRCTMHFAVHDYGEQRRDMYRMSIKGEPNVGPRD